MRRTAALLATLIAGALFVTAGDARILRELQTGGALSCPDPSVVDAHVGAYRYYLVCTTDAAPNAFPIRGSSDLLHWHLIGYVFPAGAQPNWALPSPIGRFWAPAIYRIDGRWVVYFAAQYNAARVAVRVSNERPGTWAIGVATSSSLNGPWHSSLLHYRGEFNHLGGEQERYGGVIDPSMVQDTITGQRFLFWAEQSTAIWATRLSADGLTLDPHIHHVLQARSGWEGRTPNRRSVVEGPEEYFHDGWFYLFYSGASTWTGSYAVGAAVSTDPLHGRFADITDQPVLESGHGWLGPGGTSAPVRGPDGKTYILYHVETRPNRNHVSADRYLMLSALRWVGLGGYFPQINDGRPG